MSIAVAGAGAFGTALAISLARAGQSVVLWGRDADRIEAMKSSGRNAAYLPDVPLQDEIKPSSDFADLAGTETVLLSVPMQKLGQLARDQREVLNGKTLVACCKGIDLVRLTGPTDILQDTCPDSRAAILTGPSFAADIARGLPTALTLACKNEATGETLQQALTTPNLRIYRTTDTLGAELGGALKNVMAIACGAVMGADLGESARAALMTRGYAEMKRLAQALGAKPQTLSGLSGFGDLALTCTSDQSRNYRFGQSLGRSEPFDPNITVEGAATAKAASALAKKHNIDMPITNAVAALSSGDVSVQDVLKALLSRPLKEE